ncbi:MAG: SusC/RagA family TonB-linked outer membrane protein [Odoribacter sp.]|nr:SusC/RagA family TonB-linked outer membrane protein [Odoribacter sp.]
MVSDKNSDITIWADGYYTVNQNILERDEINVVLIPESRIKYNEKVIMPFRNEELTPTSIADNLARKDMIEYSTVEKALSGNFAGLNVIGKSGMPGEGAYINLRGVRSFLATNQPLIVINGVPFLPDTDVSTVVSGYSRSLFSTLALRNVENVTLLKGADAALYGSMGSNGVLLIETSGASGSSDLETKITFAGQYGVNWNRKRLLLLGVSDYKAYLTDIGMTDFQNMADLFDKFPFLQDDPDYFYNYLYNNNTNWQNEIYKPSFITDNYFRVEGGDAIAKYDLSFDYQREGGIIDNTNKGRYYTLLNALITVSRKVDIFATAGLGYSNSDLQEQGMIPETNPVLAAYAASPVTSPYLKDSDNNTLSDYNIYYYDASNPKAITNTLLAKVKDFDFNLRAGLNYRPTDFLTFSGQVGINYFYNQEQIFIPGKTSLSILPLSNGLAENTVRNGVAEAINMYYSVNGAYKNIFNDIHALNAIAGMQILTSRQEYDAGEGYNTANDFYQMLNNASAGRMFTGYINTWNWMNFFGHIDYTYNNLIKTSFNLAVDGSSSSGTDATRFGAFPSASVVWMLGNSRMLINSTTVNRLNLRAEYGLTGNSRFSSNYGRNYYTSAQYKTYSGIVRVGIPNTKLGWEKHLQFNVGADLSLFYNRLSLGFDYYNIQSRDVVFNQPISSVYGSRNYYANSGKIQNDGFELSLQASVIDMNDFEWIVGGNIAF